MHTLNQVLIPLLLTVLAVTDNDYSLILHPFDQGAACLDGSPAGMYIWEGVGESRKKFMLYMNGASFCGGYDLSDTLEKCYQMSSGEYGTTSIYPNKKNYDHAGMLSTDPDVNPVFYDWTKVFIISCDGMAHQGARPEPIQYKGTKLYFRGTNNTLQQFAYLDEKYDFYNQDTIVLMGISAGGMGTFQWAEYLNTHTKTSKVIAMPDSGLFLVNYQTSLTETKPFRVGIQNILKVVNPKPSDFGIVFQKCIEELQGDIPSCFDASNTAKYTQVPIFMIQSPIDSKALEIVVGTQCMTNDQPPYSLQTCNQTTISVINNYQTACVEAMTKIKGERNDVGAWGPACVQHGFIAYRSYKSEDYEVPAKTGTQLYAAIQHFLQHLHDPAWEVEGKPWPSNPGCSGLTGVLQK